MVFFFFLLFLSPWKCGHPLFLFLFLF
jgi:hypothetical protein